MIQFSKYTLPNGLRVIHHHDISTPLVCMNILYDVGARDEDENKTGFAHLFEHLMFGGSVNIPNYDEPLQMVGGENNAFTTNDITNYYLTLPADNVETAFWLESDRMMSLAFGDKSLEVQRNVVIEEFKQRYLNQPYGDVWLILKPLCYKVHPYKWNTIGKEIKHIEDATMEDVKHFFKTHYHPSNAILVVAGNIDFNKTEALTEKWFGGIESQAKQERNLPKEPKQNEARTLTVERNVPQNAIYKAYHVCNRYHADYYCMDVISDILSNGDSARLYNSLVKEQKLFTEINAYITGDLDEWMFIVSGKLCEGISFEQAEQAINHELEMMKKEALNDNELQKIKNKIESIHVFSETSISNKALNLAVAELMGDANRVNTEIDYYLNMKAADIQAAANLYLQQENSNTLYYQKSNQ
jgi:zinc protease